MPDDKAQRLRKIVMTDATPEDASYTITTGNDPIENLGNNCGEKKAEIQRRFDEAKFGTCFHPAAVDADAYAYTVLLVQLTEAGAVFNVEVGHKTVRNTAGRIPVLRKNGSAYISVG
jgi:hypothetical protein